jgi:dipeptidyl aminopeptidase/acylaminoacyl peptidase
VDRKGIVEPLNLRAAPYEFPRVSPDGHSVAIGTDDGKVANVWIYDLSGTTAARQLTFGGRNKYPVWTADGKRVAFQSDRETDLAIFWQLADGTGTAERLTKPDKDTAHIPESASPDGKTLSFDVATRSEHALWTLALADQKVIFPELLNLLTRWAVASVYVRSFRIGAISVCAAVSSNRLQIPGHHGNTPYLVAKRKGAVLQHARPVFRR